MNRIQFIYIPLIIIINLKLIGNDPERSNPSLHHHDIGNPCDWKGSLIVSPTSLCI